MKLNWIDVEGKETPCVEATSFAYHTFDRSKVDAIHRVYKEGDFVIAETRVIDSYLPPLGVTKYFTTIFKKKLEYNKENFDKLKLECANNAVDLAKDGLLNEDIRSMYSDGLRKILIGFVDYTLGLEFIEFESLDYDKLSGSIICYDADKSKKLVEANLTNKFNIQATITQYED